MPCRYDFIADINGKLIRIQCKSCHLIDDEESGITFECRTTRNVKQGIYNEHRKYLETEIDYFYTCWDNVGYLIPISECSSTKTLRFKPSKNGRITNINFAINYQIEKKLQELNN